MKKLMMAVLIICLLLAAGLTLIPSPIDAAAYNPAPSMAMAGPLAVNRLLDDINICLLYTSPSPRDLSTSRMPSSA